MTRTTAARGKDTIALGLDMLERTVNSQRHFRVDNDNRHCTRQIHAYTIDTSNFFLEMLGLLVANYEIMCIHSVEKTESIASR